MLANTQRLDSPSLYEPESMKLWMSPCLERVIPPPDT